MANPNRILQQYLARRQLTADIEATATTSHTGDQASQAPAIEATATTSHTNDQTFQAPAPLCAVRSVSDGVDYSDKHFNYFRLRKWALLECGGAGDCFFYSVLFLNKLNGYQYPEMRRTHPALRKQLVTHFTKNQDTILANEQPVKLLLKCRPQNYLSKMSETGEFVEYETLCAFSHMIEAPVVVWSKDCDLPLVIFPNGRALGRRESVPSTIFKLWTNGWHYQALAAVAQCNTRNAIEPPNLQSPFILSVRDVVFPE